MPGTRVTALGERGGAPTLRSGDYKRRIGAGGA